MQNYNFINIITRFINYLKFFLLATVKQWISSHLTIWDMKWGDDPCWLIRSVNVWERAVTEWQQAKLTSSRKSIRGVNPANGPVFRKRLKRFADSRKGSACGEKRRASLIKEQERFCCSGSDRALNVGLKLSWRN